MANAKACAPGDHRLYVVQVSVGVFWLMLNSQLQRSEGLFLDRFCLESATGQAERVDPLLDDVQIDPGVNQGAKHHVAADSASTI